VWPEASVGGGSTASEALSQTADQEVDLLARSWVIEERRSGRYWVGAQILLFLGIAVALIMDGSVPWATYPEVDLQIGGTIDAWRAVGVVLLVVGGVGLVVSARSLGRALTAMPEPVEGANLVEIGPYAHARHPIYGFACLLMLGASLMMASTAATMLSLVLPFFFWAKSSYEERQLRIAYAGYTAYRTRVRRRLIPFIL
jgi:protein-S-isoprenylcysteine O-methyltransferase Ste14